MTPLTACLYGGALRFAEPRVSARPPDQATVEYQPATDVPGHFLLVHLYLLPEMGSPVMEIAYLEELARDRVYEFASRRCVCVALPDMPLRG
jgi:hypothetical protein